MTQDQHRSLLSLNTVRIMNRQCATYRASLVPTLAAALVCTPRTEVRAQPTDAVIVAVSLDRPDWKYRVGDSAVFRVAVLRGGHEVPRAKVSVALAQERMKPMRVDTVDGTAAGVVLKGTLSAPGFLRATATARVDGVTYTGMATAAFSPELIDASTTMPDDFLAFWQKAICRCASHAT